MLFRMLAQRVPFIIIRYVRVVNINFDKIKIVTEFFFSKEGRILYYTYSLARCHRNVYIYIASTALK